MGGHGSLKEQARHRSTIYTISTVAKLVTVIKTRKEGWEQQSQQGKNWALPLLDTKFSGPTKVRWGKEKM